MFYEYQRSVGENYLRVRKDGSENLNFPLHLHKSFELVCVEKGTLTVHIAGEDHTLRANEMAIIFPGQLHAFSSPERNRSRICIFSADYLPDLEAGHTPLLREAQDFMDRLYENRHQRFAVKALLYGMAAKYVQGAPYRAPESENDNLICRVVQYIEAHYFEPISLQGMAEELGYNYRYLSGVVNRCFKTGFPKVVNRFRVDLACRLLKKENSSITEVAGQCGFDSLRNFNRCFKEITGKTPREYRRSN